MARARVSISEGDSDTDKLATLEAQLRQREREIAVLRETAQAVGSELDLDKVFQLIAERARELIQAETVLVPILNRECNEYTYRAGSGTHAEEIVGESLPLDFGVCGWVWKHMRPWWRGTLAELEPQERNLWEEQAGTMIMVPLIGRRHFLGGIAGMNKRGGGEFNRNDLHLLELFAGQAAIAIENAMAMEKIDQSRRLAQEAQIELQRVNKRLSAANRELEYLSLYDPLTGLPNRSLFRDQLRRALETTISSGAALSLLIIDIDRFQEINDTLGHDVGDEILRATAARLSAAVGTEGSVGRMSGDEFAVLLGRNGHDALQVARQMRNGLVQVICAGDHELVITASIGIASCPDHGKDISTLFRCADAAMVSAKHEAGGIAAYDEAHDAGLPGRLALAVDLRKALHNREFALHYQPKLDLATQRLAGVEALARWPRENGTAVPPDMFVSALEQTGLIAPFTYWALETAVAQREAWLERGWHISVAVNVPLSVVMEPSFLAELSRIVAGREIRDGLLLEITENIFLGDYERINEVLGEVRAIGLGCSIDDFGTGHSSLVRLRQLPVGEIKVDRSFVMAMLDNKDDEVIVRSTIDLAHNLGLKVVAEGVENARLLDALSKLGCDVVQGYHISRPLPVEQLEKLFESGRWTMAVAQRSNGTS
jgi:diguanylate cyclase